MTHTLKEKWGQLPDPQIISKGCCHAKLRDQSGGGGVSAGGVGCKELPTKLHQGMSAEPQVVCSDSPHQHLLGIPAIWVWDRM